ncbi:MAG: penicillin acylase family protein [Myxococcota bacterium]
MPTDIQEIFEDDLDESLFSSFTGDVGMYYARPFVYFLEATAANIDAIDNGTAVFPSSSGLNFFDDSDTAGKVETRDEDLLKAFSRAVTYLQGKLGADMSQWHWERLHQWSISDQTQPWLGTPNQGPYGVDGYGFAVDCSDGTLFSNNDLPSNFSVGKIPTIKMIMDFSDGEIQAYNTIPGGQSEDPSSVHYNDQTLTWISDTSPPLPFTREEVVAETEERWTLPQGFPEVARVVEQ